MVEPDGSLAFACVTRNGMTNRQSAAWTTPPGETIEDLIEERGWTREELARRMGCSIETLGGLLDGSAAIDEATAMALASVLGSTSAFWLERERRYRNALAGEKGGGNG